MARQSCPATRLRPPAHRKQERAPRARTTRVSAPLVLSDIVGDFIEVMESKSKVIEAEKLKAIGLGNKVDHEKEVRKRKQAELQAMINEKKAELERLSAQHDSLTSVELQQKAALLRLGLG